MIPRQRISPKKTGLWLLLGICSLIAVCIAMIGIISIWTGFSHKDQNGYWVPILAGTVSLIAACLFGFCSIKPIFLHMKDKDVLAH